MGKNNSHVAQAMRPKYGRMDGGKATHKHTHTPLNDIYTNNAKDHTPYKAQMGFTAL